MRGSRRLVRGNPSRVSLGGINSYLARSLGDEAGKTPDTASGPLAIITSVVVLVISCVAPAPSTG